MENRKNYIYIQPKSDHTHTLIFLHGLGDSAEGFESVFE
jgi:predicted esterase